VVWIDGATIYLGGRNAGEPGYRAPEVAREEAAYPASDLFSLGTMLYELVAGRRAFAGETTLEVLLATLAHEPTLPKGAPTLTAICQRLLAKAPEHRPRSALDVAEQLLLAPTAATPVPDEAAPKLRETIGRYIIPTRSVAAAWARSCSHTTPISIAASRSSSCFPSRSAPGARRHTRACSAKRRRWRGSRIRTSSRSTRSTRIATACTS
jgi:serine/threonine protein kinase